MAFRVRDPATVTTAGAASVLGVSKDTIIRMVAAGELAATFTPAGHARILRADVERMVDPPADSEAA